MEALQLFPEEDIAELENVIAQSVFHILTTSLTLLSLPMTSLNCLPSPSLKAPALRLLVKSSYAG